MTKRLISGIQPTGKMHLGNYHGAIKNWVNLQDAFDSFFLIVDLHSLTTVYENTIDIKANKADLALDLLAVGVDPEKACLFFQSDITQHADLHLILSMITPLPWLQRVPTYKGKMSEIKGKDLETYGFLGYPVLMAADILLYRGEVVPVGSDQLPHLELAREIARRFNHLYKTELFPIPADKQTETTLLPGTDGRKMSKSYNNTIPVTGAKDDINARIMKMVTDPKRIRKTDPGDPAVCPVFDYHKIYNTTAETAQIEADCKAARMGCVDCKKQCAQLVNAELEPIREKRRYYESRPDDVKSIFDQGAKKAQKVAEKTMSQVRGSIGL